MAIRPYRRPTRLSIPQQLATSRQKLQHRLFLSLQRNYTTENLNQINHGAKGSHSRRDLCLELPPRTHRHDVCCTDRNRLESSLMPTTNTAPGVVSSSLLTHNLIRRRESWINFWKNLRFIRWLRCTGAPENRNYVKRWHNIVPEAPIRRTWTSLRSFGNRAHNPGHTHPDQLHPGAQSSKPVSSRLKVVLVILIALT